MPENAGELSPLAMRELLRELRVHQIELELQNEELRTTEESLEFARARYRDLYEHAPVGYLSLDAQGRAVDVNATAVEMLRADRESIVGEPLSHFILRTEQDNWYLCMKRLASTGVAQSCEVRFAQEGGEPFWARLEVSPRATLEGAASRVAIVDIDEQYRAEQERRRSDALFETLFRCSNDAILTLAPPSWRVRSANPAALELFGAGSVEELASLALWDHAPPMPGGVPAAAGFAHEGAHRFEWSLKRLSGESFPASISLSHAELEGERMLLAAVRDETEANALRARLARADRVNGMGLLAASVAHEINNPLTYVLVMIEGLAEWLPELTTHLPELARALRERLGAPDTDALLEAHAELLEEDTLQDMADRARGALDATRRIRNIAMALGTFARAGDTLEHGIDLHRPIHSALEMAGNEIRHRARLCLHLETVPPVRGSEGQLSQVFLNLLINAVRAFETDVSEEQEITVTTWSKGPDVYAEVRDTGVGIAADVLEHVFEPFVSTRPTGLGTGLGLSICQDIVTRHGGEIRIESEVGVGTRAIVRLPIDDTPRRPRVATRPDQVATRPPPRRGRVLVVDDEPALRHVMVRVLRDHEVVLAASGAEAMAILLEDRRFDVVLCDLMMPGMSGIELHQWLTELDAALAARTVFVTGGAFTSGSEDYLAEVRNIVVHKPFEASELRELVNDLLREHAESALAD